MFRELAATGWPENVSPMQHEAHESFDRFVAEHPEGSKLRGRVTNVRPFGVFCELAPGIEGLLEVVDFEGRPQPMTFPDHYPRVGDALHVTIEYINHDARRIRLTQRRPTRALT